jgi:hypothetical protein
MTISFTEPSPLQIQEEILETYFEEPVPLNLSVASLDGSSRVIGNEVPYPFEIPLPYEEVITEELYVERPLDEAKDIPLSFECFVQKQASYGLLDGKYLIRY